MKNILYIICYLLLGIQMTNAQTNQDNIVVMQLKNGNVKIELSPDVAPKHVERFKLLSSEGFYDNVVFHRVIAGFMAQTGDPTGTGMGGSKLPNLKAEFNPTKHLRGVVSMARSANPDSANSQFFIMLADSPHLDGQYTAFGRVIEGMELVDQIKKGDVSNNGTVENPDKIIKMRPAEEMK
jgi:peptidylprolyl isomerase